MAARELFGAAARNDAILNLTFSEILERARRELFLSGRRAVARKLVEYSRKFRRDENSEVLVGVVLGDVGRKENLHCLTPVHFFELAVQLGHQCPDAGMDSVNARETSRFGVQNARHRIHGAVEISVHYNITI